MRKRLTYSNVMATVAVFIALGAGAYAAGLPKDSVKAKQIKAGAVRGDELADDSVTAAKVLDGSLREADFAPGQLPAGAPGATGATGAQGPPGEPGAPATKLFAYVGASGNLIYGKGATAVTHNNSGLYTVEFDRPLANCVAFANIGQREPDGDYGQIFGHDLAEVDNIAATSVVVATLDPATGTERDSTFEVAVLC
jgi:hypothetical protein